MTKLDELTAEERQVYWVLEFHSPKDECYLQNWEIAKLSGIKRRTRVVAPPPWNQEQIRAERTIELRKVSG